MSTVNNKINISKNDIQGVIEDFSNKFNLSEINKKRLIKVARSNKIKGNQRKVLFEEIKKIMINDDNCKVGRHFTVSERTTLQVLHQAGFSNGFIGNLLNKNRSNIGRELERNQIELVNYDEKGHMKRWSKDVTYFVYDSNEAQKKYIERRKKSKKRMKMEVYPEIARYIKYMIDKKHKWGADIFAYQINSGKAEIDAKISAQTIYNMARKNLFGLSMVMFPHGEYKKKSENMHAQSKEISPRKEEHSIEKLDEKVKTSVLYFEGDSVIGKKEGGGNTILTFANPKTKFYAIYRSQNKTANATCKALHEIDKNVFEGENIMNTILFDNGCEFSDFNNMMLDENGEKIREIYFAHPYSSYERGCNENKNRELRGYVPKGKKIEELSDEYLKFVMIRINNKPRKSLNYRTALECFKEELEKLGYDTCFLEKYKDPTLQWKKRL